MWRCVWLASPAIINEKKKKEKINEAEYPLRKKENAAAAFVGATKAWDELRYINRASPSNLDATAALPSPVDLLQLALLIVISTDLELERPF